jgi:metal-dependent amidase/aminoacylase/carboxypeptidase family protein
MCGHDGHLASLAALIPLFIARMKEISSNKALRLIFQPSEESGKGRGALGMIEEGCLSGID